MTLAWRSFGDLWPLVAFGGVCALVLVVAALRGTPRTRRVVLLALLGLWALLFAAVTMTPAGVGGRSVELMPGRDVLWAVRGVGGLSHLTAQIGGNIAMAVPVGLLLRVLWGPGRQALHRTLLWSGLFFCVIEATQWLLALGRVSTVDDVLLGLVGSTLGWLAGRPVPEWQRAPKPVPAPPQPE